MAAQHAPSAVDENVNPTPLCNDRIARRTKLLLVEYVGLQHHALTACRSNGRDDSLECLGAATKDADLGARRGERKCH